MNGNVSAETDCHLLSPTLWKMFELGSAMSSVVGVVVHGRICSMNQDELGGICAFLWNGMEFLPEIWKEDLNDVCET